MHHTKILITPQEAKEWLATKNLNNRPLKQQNVAKLAQEMRAGRWKLNGETVKFAKSGRILDGQHRLAACVAANVPFETAVVHGVDDDAFDTIDTGATRSFMDTLAVRGDATNKNLAAGTRFVWDYGMGLFRSKGSSLKAIATNQLLEQMLDKHKGLRNSARLYSMLSKRPGGVMIPPSVGVGLHYLFSLADHEKADSFFQEIQSGLNLKDGSAVAALRAKLIQTQRERSATVMKRDAVYACIVQAWNAYYQGKTLKKITWTAQQDLPEIADIPQNLMKDLL